MSSSAEARLAKRIFGDYCKEGGRLVFVAATADRKSSREIRKRNENDERTSEKSEYLQKESKGLKARDGLRSKEHSKNVRVSC